MIQTGVLKLDAKDASEGKPDDFSTFTQVTFPTPFPPDSKVVVVPMVQSFHGPDTPGLRIGKVNERGFMIRMNELAGWAGGKRVFYSDGKHVEERVGWIAFTV